MTISDRVNFGTPITTAQAVRAILRMLKTPIIGDVDADSGPGHTLRRLAEDGEVYPCLSGGEKKLVQIARSVWSGGSDVGARISVIGGLDRDNRRRIIVILAYLYLGRDELVELGASEWPDWFSDRVPRP